MQQYSFKMFWKKVTFIPISNCYLNESGFISFFVVVPQGFISNFFSLFSLVQLCCFLEVLSDNTVCIQLNLSFLDFRRKTMGLAGNKKALEVNLPESSRKFITCIRKYMLFYLKLLEETGDISTLDRAYISLRADKRVINQSSRTFA